MVTVKRKKGESFESLQRRFTRRVQQSGQILESKKNRFFSAKLNKTKQKESAIRRMQLRVKRDYLLKTGQLLVEDRFGGKK